MIGHRTLIHQVQNQFRIVKQKLLGYKNTFKGDYFPINEVFTQMCYEHMIEGDSF